MVADKCRKKERKAAAGACLRAAGRHWVGNGLPKSNRFRAQTIKKRPGCKCRAFCLLVAIHHSTSYRTDSHEPFRWCSLREGGESIALHISRLLDGIRQSPVGANIESSLISVCANQDATAQMLDQDRCRTEPKPPIAPNGPVARDDHDYEVLLRSLRRPPSDLLSGSSHTQPPPVRGEPYGLEPLHSFPPKDRPYKLQICSS